jgi:hypothetical protein
MEKNTSKDDFLDKKTWSSITASLNQLVVS